MPLARRSNATGARNSRATRWPISCLRSRRYPQPRGRSVAKKLAAPRLVRRPPAMAAPTGPNQLLTGPGEKALQDGSRRPGENSIAVKAPPARISRSPHTSIARRRRKPISAGERSLPFSPFSAISLPARRPCRHHGSRRPGQGSPRSAHDHGQGQDGHSRPRDSHHRLSLP